MKRSRIIIAMLLGKAQDTSRYWLIEREMVVRETDTSSSVVWRHANTIHECCAELTRSLAQEETDKSITGNWTAWTRPALPGDSAMTVMMASPPSQCAHCSTSCAVVAGPQCDTVAVPGQRQCLRSSPFPPLSPVSPSPLHSSPRKRQPAREQSIRDGACCRWQWW